MSKKIEIESLKINIGGKEFDLTPEEARLLRDKLNEVFGQITPAPVITPYPWTGPPYSTCDNTSTS